MSEPRIPRWRFSIRILLVILAILAFAISSATRRANNQRAALAKIRDLGGKVYYGYELDGRDRQFSPAPDVPGPSWLRHWIGDDYFRTVVTIDLNIHQGSDLLDDDELLFLLKRLPHVEYLRLGDQSKITNESVAAITRLRRLKSLTNTGTSIDSQSLNPLVERPDLILK